MNLLPDEEDFHGVADFENKEEEVGEEITEWDFDSEFDVERGTYPSDEEIKQYEAELKAFYAEPRTEVEEEVGSDSVENLVSDLVELDSQLEDRRNLKVKDTDVDDLKASDDGLEKLETVYSGAKQEEEAGEKATSDQKGKAAALEGNLDTMEVKYSNSEPEKEESEEKPEEEVETSSEVEVAGEKPAEVEENIEDSDQDYLNPFAKGYCGKEYFASFLSGDRTVDPNHWHHFDLGPFRAGLYGWSHTRQYASGFLCNSERGCDGKMKLQIEGLERFQRYEFKIYQVAHQHKQYNSVNRFRIETADDEWKYVKNVWTTNRCMNKEKCPPAVKGIVSVWNGPLVFRWHRDSNHVHISGVSIRAYCGPTFMATIQGHNGEGTKTWMFQKVFSSINGGNMDQRHREECAQINMKPVCDHPSYCKTDDHAVYLGQQHHVCHGGHLQSHSPKGMRYYKGLFMQSCCYTGGHGGHHQTLCETGGSHRWSSMGQHGDRTFLCAMPAPVVFQLGARHHIKERVFEFSFVQPYVFGGDFSTIMRNECMRRGMRPLCDHPSYCRHDSNSIYIGQDHHMSHQSNLRNAGYYGKGWNNIVHSFDHMCFYTANAHRHHALCNHPYNSHSWQRAAYHASGFVCARTWRPEPVFTTLSSRRGVPQRRWKFQYTFIDVPSGNIKDIMKRDCGRLGMKPVCDHPHYCQNDLQSYYLGQDHHAAHAGNRYELKFWPEGWSRVAWYFDDSCTWTAGHGGANTLCNSPSNTHRWLNTEGGGSQTPFVCAQVAKFTQTLGPRHNVPQRSYEFQIFTTDVRGGHYRATMRENCLRVGMRPVCDHPHYCDYHRGYYESIYIGQDHHIALPGHRNNNGFFPTGWKKIRSYWDGLCSYTANHGHGALCNIPANTHSWQYPSDQANSFMCGRIGPFKATLGARNGVPRRSYEFRHFIAYPTSGYRINSFMIQTCKEHGMKPICDHKSYCKNNKESLYLGQDHHASHRSHMINDAYWPGGWAAIKENFYTTCFYTAVAHANGHQTLCNTPWNSHQWRGIDAYSNSWICGRVTGFQATLGEKNGVPKLRYDFRIIETENRGPSYSEIMVSDCAKVGMRPICDHPNYCKNNFEALYLGQNEHLAYKPHRDDNNRMPEGFASIKEQWDYTCAYTAHHGAPRALCHHGNTHHWRYVYNDNSHRFICGQVATFKAVLGTKNGVMERKYEFKPVTTGIYTGDYSEVMVHECAKHGMKPICDHPNYCKGDHKALYIGQTHHISHFGHMMNTDYFGAGWADIKDNFRRLCYYTGKHGGHNRALCNHPKNEHSWQALGSVYASFMCGKVLQFRQRLGEKNGVPSRRYVFSVVSTNQRDSRFSDIMVNECSARGMKPICDFPNYCKDDVNSLYLGQSSHLAHPKNRGEKKNWPSGWMDIKDNWDGLCSYTGSHGTGALCNIPANDHSWRSVGEDTNSFVCGRVASFTVTLGAKNGVGQSMYKMRVVTTDIRSSKFSTAMVAECKKYGMKPLCDHPNYCKNDKQSLYIGQTHHISDQGVSDNHLPDGFKKVKRNFKGICAYTGAHGPKGQTMCDQPRMGRSWQALSDTSNSFMCGKTAVPRKKRGRRKGSNVITAGRTYTDRMDGWNNEKTTTCGAFGKILGGYNIAGKGYILKKAFTLPCERSKLKIQFKFARIDSWDNEDGWMKVNGEQKWRKTGQHSGGSNACGSNAKDELWSITVNDVAAKGRTLVLEFGTTLNSAPNDESWGIKDIRIDVSCQGCSKAIDAVRTKLKGSWEKLHGDASDKNLKCKKELEARKKQLTHHQGRANSHNTHAQKCAADVQKLKKERDRLVNLKKRYKQEYDQHKHEKEKLLKARDDFKKKRDNFKKEKEELERRIKSTTAEGDQARKDCEAKRGARTQFWAKKLEDRKAEWTRKLREAKSNLDDRTKFWKDKYSRLEEQAKTVKKQRDDYSQKRDKFSGELNKCKKQRADRSVHWKRKYARRQRYWERKIKDSRGAAEKTENDWKRKLENQKKSMARRIKECNDKKEESIKACQRDKDTRLTRWKKKQEERENYWTEKFDGLKKDNSKAQAELQTQVNTCKTKRSEAKAKCQTDQRQCVKESEGFKAEMNKYKDKAELATESRRRADAAFKEISAKVNGLESKARKCETKRRDRNKFHTERFNKLQNSHEDAKNQVKMCKKQTEHSKYLHKNYKDMFTMVRGHANDLKAQRDKARTRSTAMGHRLEAYKKKCGELESDWRKKYRIKEQEELKYKRLYNQQKEKAKTLQTKISKQNIDYKRLEDKGEASKRSFEQKLKAEKQKLEDEKQKFQRDMKEREERWKRKEDSIVKKENETIDEYKERLRGEKSKFMKEERDIKEKWETIAKKQRQKETETTEQFKRRLKQSEGQYRTAAKFVNKYSEERKAHKEDVASLKEKISQDEAKAKAVLGKEQKSLDKYKKKVADERSSRASAEEKATKFKSMAKKAETEAKETDEVLKNEKKEWEGKLDEEKKEVKEVQKKIEEQDNSFQSQLSVEEAKEEAQKREREEHWKKSLEEEKITHNGVDKQSIEEREKEKLAEKYRAQMAKMEAEADKVQGRTDEEVDKERSELRRLRRRYKKKLQDVEAHPDVSDQEKETQEKLKAENTDLQAKLMQECPDKGTEEANQQASKLGKVNSQLQGTLDKREQQILKLEKRWLQRKASWKREAEHESNQDTLRVSQLQALVAHLQQSLSGLTHNGVLDSTA